MICFNPLQLLSFFFRIDSLDANIELPSIKNLNVLQPLSLYPELVTILFHVKFFAWFTNTHFALLVDYVNLCSRILSIKRNGFVTLLFRVFSEKLIKFITDIELNNSNTRCQRHKQINPIITILELRKLHFINIKLIYFKLVFLCRNNSFQSLVGLQEANVTCTHWEGYFNLCILNSLWTVLVEKSINFHQDDVCPGVKIKVYLLEYLSNLLRLNRFNNMIKLLIMCELFMPFGIIAFKVVP